MKRREKHTFYNHQFKHTAVKITDHPNIQSVDVAEALGIHPIMLYRWRQEMRADAGDDAPFPDAAVAARHNNTSGHMGRHRQ